MSTDVSKTLAQGHIPALDGIRGIAVTLVVVMHFLGTVVPSNSLENFLLVAAGKGGAFIDAFFILSGFLITGILLDSKEKPRFFSNFFVRRTLRIFPLYYAILFFITILVFFAPQLAGPEGTRFREAAPWAWTYTYNFFVALKGNWTITSTDHFWSLAVEEQFYLFWPLVVFYLSRRALIRFCWVAIALSTVLFPVLQLGYDFTHVQLHVLTPLRLNSLCAGALLAALLREPGVISLGNQWALAKGKQFFWGSVLGKVLILVLGALFPLTHHSLEVFRNVTWIAFFVAFHFFAICQYPTLAKSLLEQRFFIFMGQYSYGIYLFHCFFLVPIKTFNLHAIGKELLGNSTLSMLAIVLLGTTVSTALAYVSFHLFEKQFLKLKDVLAPK